LRWGTLKEPKGLFFFNSISGKDLVQVNVGPFSQSPYLLLLQGICYLFSQKLLTLFLNYLPELKQFADSRISPAPVFITKYFKLHFSGFVPHGTSSWFTRVNSGDYTSRFAIFNFNFFDAIILDRNNFFLY